MSDHNNNWERVKHNYQFTGYHNFLIQKAYAIGCEQGDLGKCFNMDCPNSVKICIGNSALCSSCHVKYSANDFGGVVGTISLKKYVPPQSK